MAPGEHLDLPDDISQMDLVSWTFANLDNEDYDPEKKIYVNPDDPSLSISASEARITVRKLIAGFKAVGLQSGDCVCVHAFNNVRTTGAPLLVSFSAAWTIGLELAEQRRAGLISLVNVLNAISKHCRGWRMLHRFKSSIHDN